MGNTFLLRLIVGLISDLPPRLRGTHSLITDTWLTVSDLPPRLWGTDSESFRAFIAAKHPNGLESNVETIDRVLQNNPEVQRMFRTIISESRQGERVDIDSTRLDIDDTTSRHHGGKLENLSSRNQERIRAANRAAEAIPVINELLDKGLIL